MAIEYCEKGHYWDNEKYDSCPTCAGSFSSNIQLKSDVLEKTVNERHAGTVPIGAAFGGSSTIPVGGASPTVPVAGMSAAEDGRTVPVYQLEGSTGKINPVIGWLVCVEGVEKGKDYRLHGGYNTIGREAKNDVCIRGDDQISRENNAWIGYDMRSKKFLFGAGESSTNFVYVNDQPLPRSQSVVLEPHDRIGMGASVFMFVPFVGDSFDWNEA